MTCNDAREQRSPASWRCSSGIRHGIERKVSCDGVSNAERRRPRWTIEPCPTCQSGVIRRRARGPARAARAPVSSPFTAALTDALRLRGGTPIPRGAALRLPRRCAGPRRRRVDPPWRRTGPWRSEATPRPEQRCSSEGARWVLRGETLLLGGAVFVLRGAAQVLRGGGLLLRWSSTGPRWSRLGPKRRKREREPATRGSHSGVD